MSTSKSEAQTALIYDGISAEGFLVFDRQTKRWLRRKCKGLTKWLRLAAPGYCSACIGGAYAVAPGRALAVAIRLLPARHTSRHSSLQARAFYWRPAKGLSYSYNLFPSKGGVHIHQIALELVARILWSRHRISI